jgi:hypothetical protein
MGARYDAAVRDGLPKEARAAALRLDELDEAAGIPPKNYPPSTVQTVADFDKPPKEVQFHRLVRTPRQEDARLVQNAVLATVASIKAVEAIQKTEK